MTVVEFEEMVLYFKNPSSNNKAAWEQWKTLTSDERQRILTTGIRDDSS